MNLPSFRAHLMVGSLTLGLAGTFTQASDFPRHELIPKAEVGGTALRELEPQADGRGILVAVFDTGVDPGAPGLQRTSDGKPKIVDMIDASGSGDVALRKVSRNKEGHIPALSGHNLQWPADWPPPKGDIRVGIKPAYDLFPKPLVDRLRKERLEDWLKVQRVHVRKARQALEDFDREHPHPKDGEKETRQDLKDRVDQLEALQKNWKDPGPLLDCVAIHDGKTWRAVVDTDSDGDLGDEKLLASYREEQEYAQFTGKNQLNFALSVLNGGNLLSIITDCGSHGTHVAGIIAAHHPGHPELDGLAPGAQIVSVKIGDSRMGSSSMGTGTSRGLIASHQLGCHLINMSYGGADADPNRSAQARLISEFVQEHGIIFVSSAGNNGPAISTVGSPGGTTSAVFGIGAYVTPAMMEAQYSLREAFPTLPYTWSSRGPTLDGDWGVDFSAPGGAITSIPNWELSGGGLKNGTSMSSPNACGAIALLLSALKAENKTWTPDSIRRALTATAEPPPNTEARLAEGHGRIRVDRALRWIRQSPSLLPQDARIEIRNPATGGRGILLREIHETAASRDHEIQVRAIFAKEADPEHQIAFEKAVELETSADWVTAPKHLWLHHEGRSLKIQTHPERLSPGIHTTQVIGREAGRQDGSALFSIPVTVIRPHEQPQALHPVEWTVELEHGRVERRFIQPPSGSRWMDVQVHADKGQESARLVLHTLQVLDGEHFREAEKREYLNLDPGERRNTSIPVEEGRLMEISLARYWSSLERGRYHVKVLFHGLGTREEHIEMNGADSWSAIRLENPWRPEKLDPSISFKTLRRIQRPHKSSRAPLTGMRDTLPDETHYLEQVLEYQISLPAKLEVTPRFHLTREIESQVWLLHDSSKRRIASGSSGTSFQGQKGSYTLRLQLRHTDADLLESLSQLPLQLDFKLPSAVAASIHATRAGAVLGTDRMKEMAIAPGELPQIYVRHPSTKQLPSYVQAGDVLLGTLNLGATEAGLEGSENRPGGIPVSLLVPPPPTKEDKTPTTPAKKKETDKEATASWLRKSREERLGQLMKPEQEEEFLRLAVPLLKSSKDPLPILWTHLKRLDQDATRKRNLRRTLAAADLILDRIPIEELRLTLASRPIPGENPADAEKREAEKKKEILLDALYRKARAIAYLDAGLEEKPVEPETQNDTKGKRKSRKAPVAEATEEEAKAINWGQALRAKATDPEAGAFDATFKQLASWVDMEQKPYDLLEIRRHRRAERFGTALKLLDHHMGDAQPPEKPMLEKQIKILKALEWDHWVDHQQLWLRHLSPPGWEVF